MAVFNDYLLGKWRRHALVRDGRIAGASQGFCLMCIEEKPVGEIEAHHVYPKSIYPEKAYLLSNAVTLCLSCHQGIVHSERARIDLGNWRFFVPAFLNYLRKAAVQRYGDENQPKLWVPRE